MKVMIDPFNPQRIVLNNAFSNFSIELPFSEFDFQKTIQRVEGEKQKTDEQGRLVYNDEQGNEVVFEENEFGQEVPENWTPVMVDNVVYEQVKFSSSPHKFTPEEVITKKYEKIAFELGLTYCTYCYADEFITIKDIDLAAPGHSANVGVKVLQLLAGGQVTLKPITLDTQADTLTLYLEADDNIQAEISVDGGNTFEAFIENQYITAQTVSEVILRFVESSGEKKGRVFAYGLFY